MREIRCGLAQNLRRPGTVLEGPDSFFWGGGAYVPGGMKRKGFIRTGLWAFTVIPFPGIDI